MTNAVQSLGKQAPLEEFYNVIGGDYYDALSRFGDDRIIERFLGRFTKAKTIEHLKAAYDAED